MLVAGLMLQLLVVEEEVHVVAEEVVYHQMVDGEEVMGEVDLLMEEMVLHVEEEQ